jgi:diguanylate cyclase (GGDEF)-like protein
MTGVLQACPTRQEAFEVIGKFCARLLPLDSGGIYLFPRSRNQLECVSLWGTVAVAPSFGPDECWALRRGQPHYFSGAQTDLRCAHAARDAGTASLCIPMAGQGNTIGVAHIAFAAGSGAGPGAARKRASTASLADHLALALANLDLRERLRDQSIRDPLTGLHNRRYLEESFAQELARARRGKRPLAVFMLDVDHFKKFNDAHGHEAGDAVLQALGRELRGNCRDGDIVCRFGGEEFTVILPDTPVEGGRIWAERLMRKVHAMQVKAGATVLPGVTVSMGLAIYPEHGEDTETLLQAADLALYDAKRAGRDRLATGAVPRPEAALQPK